MHRASAIFEPLDPSILTGNPPKGEDDVVERQSFEVKSSDDAF
jgi:hypothetical protein